MTTIKLHINRSVQENAAVYFEAAKKARKKLLGVDKAIEISKVRITAVPEAKKTAAPVAKRATKWFEKFRWFFSEGMLIIGGRDATTNEMVIKKHVDKSDIIFHTDMSGSPFFVIKTEGKPVSPQVLQQVANATFVFSRAMKLGMNTTDVFHVTPEQVTKEAQSGEYLTKGAFMIRGKTTYIPPRFDLAIGIMDDGAICAGPVAALVASSEKYVVMEKGNAEKPSDVAKKIQKLIGGHLDDIVRALPPGSVKVKGPAVAGDKKAHSMTVEPSA